MLARVADKLARDLVNGAVAVDCVTFDGVAALEDGREVGPGVTVVDGYVACFLLDAGDGALLLIDACADDEGVALLDAIERRGHTPEDVRLLREHGVHSFLVGEAFMRAEHPGERLAALFDLG